MQDLSSELAVKNIVGINHYNIRDWVKAEAQPDIDPWRSAAEMFGGSERYYNIRAWVNREPMPPYTALWPYGIRCWNIRDWIEQGEPAALSGGLVLAMVAAPMFLLLARGSR